MKRVRHRVLFIITTRPVFTQLISILLLLLFCSGWNHERLSRETVSQSQRPRVSVVRTQQEQLAGTIYYYHRIKKK